MGSHLKPYICTQCGGKVNRTTLKCEMCGTTFREEGEIPRIVIEAVRPEVHTLKSNMCVSREMVESLGLVKASEIALNKMARELSEAMAPFMDVQSEYQPQTDIMLIRGRIRVLDPTYRF